MDDVQETRVMFSQPMNGKTEEEIIETRNRALEKFKGYKIINTLFTDEWYSQTQISNRGVIHPSLCFLAKSLEAMSLCDIVYFCKGWKNTRGCRIEHAAATLYGLQIMYEEDDDILQNILQN